MAIYTYLHIGSNMLALLHLQALKIKQEINEHAVLNVTAKLLEKSEISYVRNVRALDKIEIINDKLEYKTIFKGVVKKVEIKQIEKSYFLLIEALSSSFLADIEVTSRSFQNKDQTYYSVVDEAIKTPFSKGLFTKNAIRKIGEIDDQITNGKTTGKFIMQYKETDWEFIKRISSHFYVGVVPSLLFDSPKITMGIPKGVNRGKIEKYNFIVKKDMEKFLNISYNTDFELEKGTVFTELDAVSFCIETTENFDIGDMLSYQYHTEDTQISFLYVKSKTTEMIDGVLRYQYELTTEGGFAVAKIYNEKIVGLSLKAKVLERIQDNIKVFLEIDKTPPTLSQAWEFHYTTPYTAEGSAGWYVMPELEDTVHIYFPNKKEECAVGLNAIRLNNTGTDKIGNPEIKYLRTRDGKELKLSNDELVLTCANWKNEQTGEENKIYIQLNEKSGITIQSTKPIYICSDGSVNFVSDKDIVFEALEEIKLKCGSSQIKLDASIEINSSVVKVN